MAINKNDLYVLTQDWETILKFEIDYANGYKAKPKNWGNKKTNRIYVGEAGDIDYIPAKDNCPSRICTGKEKTVVFADGKLYVSLGWKNKIKIFDANTGSFLKEFKIVKEVDEFSPNENFKGIGRISLSESNELYVPYTDSAKILVYDLSGNLLREIIIKDETQTYKPYMVLTKNNKMYVGVYDNDDQQGLLITDMNGIIQSNLIPGEGKIYEVDNKGNKKEVKIPIGTGKKELHPGDLIVTYGSYYGYGEPGDKSYVPPRFGHTMAFLKDSNGNGYLDGKDKLYQYGGDFNARLPTRFVIRKWRDNLLALDTESPSTEGVACVGAGCNIGSSGAGCADVT